MADSRFHIEVAIASKSERLTTLEVALQTTAGRARSGCRRRGRPRVERPTARPSCSTRRGGRRARGDRGRDRGGGRIAGPAARRGHVERQPPPPHRAPASAATPALTGANGAADAVSAQTMDRCIHPDVDTIRDEASQLSGAPRFLLLSGALLAPAHRDCGRRPERSAVDEQALFDGMYTQARPDTRFRALLAAIWRRGHGEAGTRRRGHGEAGTRRGGDTGAPPAVAGAWGGRLGRAGAQGGPEGTNHLRPRLRFQGERPAVAGCSEKPAIIRTMKR